MKKRIYLIIGISVLAVVSAVALVFAANREKGDFNGSEVRDENKFLLDYSYMDKKAEHTIHMESGDTLKVKYEIKNGRTDVIIGISGNDPIYRGNDIGTGSFELPIRETGDYIISVTAENASGKTEFSAERYETPKAAVGFYARSHGYAALSARIWKKEMTAIESLHGI